MSKQDQNVNDSVPSHFISSLRVLFEILDERRTGYVRLEDIELRWNEEGVRGLPFGVLDALRKVAPPNGCLTFEKFVSGLKLALTSTSFSKQKDTGPPPRYNKEQIYDSNQGLKKTDENAIPYYKATYVRTAPPVTVAVKPNNALNTNRRSGSNPHLNERKIEDNVPPPTRPPRPPAYRKADDVPPKIPPRDLRREQQIRKDIQLRTNPKSAEQIRSYKSDPQLDSHIPSGNKRYSEIDGIYANINQFQRQQREEEPVRHAPVQRKNSGRRHTLTSGVDHNMVVRLQQLDEERNLLIQGQKVLDEAKDWYRKQLAQLQEKQKYAGKVMFNNNSLEAHREKINFLKARIFEVNQNLKTLIESSEKGFPLHMNLAIGSKSGYTKDSTIQMVKEQNKQLTNEVSAKDKKIAILEREKSSLIRELFEARSGGKTNYDDTTFM